VDNAVGIIVKLTIPARISLLPSPLICKRNFCSDCLEQILEDGIPGYHDSPPSGTRDRSGEHFERKFVIANSNKPMLILIAGPYRSGTHDDPALLRKNVQHMESYALSIFRAGHTPIIGEWLALPLADLAGSRQVGDQAFNDVFHRIAIRLLEKCDAVLRVGGPSTGADEIVRVGLSLGLKIYTALAEIPKFDSPKAETN